MSRPKGLAKTGGRAKGTVNKSTQDLFDICEAQGLKPFEALVRALNDIDDPVKKFDSLEKVCQYLYPKRKALELSSDDEKGFQIIIKDYSNTK